MRSHPTSGSARTPNNSTPHHTIAGERHQLIPTALTPALIEEHGGDGRPHQGYQRDLLLTTKHAIPPQRTHTMVRPRLHDRLDQGLDRKLTLVAAPAGYGKTSLLSAWAQHQTSTLAWLTLDPADNDLRQFWTYVIAALDALRPGMGTHALALLWDAPAAPIEEVLTVLLNAMADLSDRLIIVLDDYHTITTPAIHHALTFLLDYLPSQLHIVLASRATPPLPIARLRARAELSELGAVDLRVTQDEATVLLQQIMGLDLTARDIGGISARTEGWITGLHLAGLARQQEFDRPAGSVTVRGSDRYLFDYLIEEVLKQQTEPVQTFLLQTALLDRLNGDLCDAVLGIENGKWKVENGSHPQDDSQSSMFNSQLILEELERANLFIIPLDTERRWYRYHPLFGEALQTYLHHTNPGMVPELQRRAAEWYEQQQGTPDAALPDHESAPMERASQPVAETVSS